MLSGELCLYEQKISPGESRICGFSRCYTEIGRTLPDCIIRAAEKRKSAFFLGKTIGPPICAGYEEGRQAAYAAFCGEIRRGAKDSSNL